MKKIIIMLLLISSGSALFAEGTGFYKGRVFLDVKGVQGAEFGGDLRTAEKALKPTVPIDLFTLSYGTEEQKRLNLYARRNRPSPKTISQGADIAMEWAVSNHLGIGFGIHGEEYKMKNLGSTPGADYTNYGLLTSVLDLNNQTPTLIQLELLNAFNDTSTVKVGTLKLAEFHMAYHFKEQSRFDPYVGVSLGLGQGQTSKTLVGKAGANLGARFFLGERFYLLSEIDYSYMELRTKPPGDTSRTGSIKHNIEETAGKVGFGVAF